MKINIKSISICKNGRFLNSSLPILISRKIWVSEKNHLFVHCAVLTFHRSLVLSRIGPGRKKSRALLPLFEDPPVPAGSGESKIINKELIRSFEIDQNSTIGQFWRSKNLKIKTLALPIEILTSERTDNIWVTLRMSSFETFKRN